MNTYLRRAARGVINRAAKSFNWQSAVTIEGRRFAVPVLGGSRVKGSEPWMTRLLRDLLAKRSGAFVDVGANLGQTMLKVCAIDPDRPYLGFEPNPICVAYLNRLMRLNRLDNCSVFPAGISTETGFFPLTLYDGDTDSSATLVPGFRRRTGATLNVAVMSEATIPFPNEIAVLKIDVEGGELAVVEGLLSTIRRTRPHIVIEILPPRDHARLERQERLQSILFGEGYSLSQIGESGNLTPAPGVGRERTMSEVDFVFSPR